MKYIPFIYTIVFLGLYILLAVIGQLLNMNIIPNFFSWGEFYDELAAFFYLNALVFYTIIIVPIFMIIIMCIFRKLVFLTKTVIIITILSFLFFYETVEVIFEFN